MVFQCNLMYRMKFIDVIARNDSDRSNYEALYLMIIAVNNSCSCWMIHSIESSSVFISACESP